MSELMTALMLWIAAATGLPPASSVPAVAFENKDTLYTLLYGKAPGARSFAEVLAVYDTSARTVRLREGWNRNDLVHVSVLLHELVHHLQLEAGLKYDCRGAMEKIAYDAQRSFLAEHGIDMAKALELDPMFLLFVNSCGGD